MEHQCASWRVTMPNDQAGKSMSPRGRKFFDVREIKEFHAKVFFGPAPEGSEYRGWSSTRRRYFIEDLLETIIANKLHPVGSAVVMDDWKRLKLRSSESTSLVPSTLSRGIDLPVVGAQVKHISFRFRIA